MDEQEQAYADAEAANEAYDAVVALCEEKGEYSPECLEANFNLLAGNNFAEWFVIGTIWWSNQPWLAFLGPLLAWYSLAIAIGILLFPEIKPDVNDGHWD